MFRHVLCVYPHRRELKKYRYCPPLGLEFIATVIHPYAQTIDIIDLRYEHKCTTDFLRHDTDLVCFSVNWKRDVELLRNEILSISPDIFTILGGRYVTEDSARWLADCPNVDAVVRGDGEEIIEDICKGVALENINGLSFRRANKIFHNPIRRLGAQKDHLYPDRALRRYAYEIEIDNINLGVKLDMVSASRGCPFNCTFCSFNRNPLGEKRTWSGRSPESIVAELAQIKAPLIGFTDELFTHDMDRVGQICDLILARGIHKKYFINARLEMARHPDVMRKMVRAGFAVLLLGIESAQDKTLYSMRKGFNTAKIREYFKVLKDMPMILHAYFILGNIGESIEEMKQIVPFAHELGVDTLMLTKLRNEPYSGIDELVAQYPDYHIATNGRIYSDHCSLKDLKRLRSELYQKFYTKRQMLRIFKKGTRSGLLRAFTQRLFKAPQFLFALKKAWKIG